MCFCRCDNKKEILIVSFILISVYFIFCIVAVYYFGSDTNEYSLYKALMNLDYNKIQITSTTSSYNYYNDYENHNISFIQKLNFFEHIFGYLLYAINFILLFGGLIYMIINFKEKNSNTEKVKWIRIVSINLLLISIIISLVYVIVIAISLSQYLNILPSSDKIDACSKGMIIGIIWGSSGIFFFISLICGLCRIGTVFQNNINISINKLGNEAQQIGNRGDLNESTNQAQQIYSRGDLNERTNLAQQVDNKEDLNERTNQAQQVDNKEDLNARTNQAEMEYANRDSD